MLNWKKPTSRPRLSAGAISAMYIGPSTDDAPIPSPPMNRASRNEYQSKANAQPTADNRYSTAVICNAFRLPSRSPGMPPNIAPRIVPHSAEDTVTPSMYGVNEYFADSAAVAPAITAVSNPNNSPPNAAITAL